VHWLWPLPVLVAAWIWALVRAGRDYPGMPCTAQVSANFAWLSYTVLFIPLAAVLLLLARWIGRARRAHERLKRSHGTNAPLAWAGGPALWAAMFTGVGILAVGAYLALGGLTVRPQDQAIACPAGNASEQPVHCWRSGTTIEINAVGQRPSSVGQLDALGQALRAHRQDAVLYEAFVYDSNDPVILNYSNAELFLLNRTDLTALGDLCLSERQAHARTADAHRVGFYRYSRQQSPPVDAFFLVDTGQSNDTGYEVVDYRHGAETLPFVRPADLLPAESAYLDKVAAGLKTLNDDLDREQLSNAPPSALSTMRKDWATIAEGLADAPNRLKPYRDSRLQRFLQNYELILVAEESAAQGQSGQAIHTSAYEDHRRYYFQEPRVTRLIGYLYLERYPEQFTDDELSAVNWAVF
jgi:hypothetical protein